MRCIPFLVVGVLFAATLAPSSLQASGGVLVPKDMPNLGLGGIVDASGSSLPNLGLVPTVSAKTSPASSAPESDSTSTPAPKKEEIPSESEENTMATEVPSMPQPNNLPFYYGDPSKLPHNIVISFSAKSSLSPADAQAIKNALGLSPGQISSTCYLSARGMLQSTVGIYPIVSSLSPTPKAGYNGNIRNVSLTATALCPRNGPPPEGPTFDIIEDRYIISLQSFDCPAPNHAAASLSVTYNGSPTPICLYQ
jgi:hypothetical protein